MKRFSIVLLLAIFSHVAFCQSLTLDQLVDPAGAFMRTRHPGCNLNSTEVVTGTDSKTLGRIANFSPSGIIIVPSSLIVAPIPG